MDILPPDLMHIVWRYRGAGPGFAECMQMLDVLIKPTYRGYPNHSNGYYPLNVNTILSRAHYLRFGTHYNRFNYPRFRPCGCRRGLLYNKAECPIHPTHARRAVAGDTTFADHRASAQVHRDMTYELSELTRSCYRRPIKRVKPSRFVSYIKEQERARLALIARAARCTCNICEVRTTGAPTPADRYHCAIPYATRPVCPVHCGFR